MRTIKERILPRVRGGVLGYFFEHPTEKPQAGRAPSVRPTGFGNETVPMGTVPTRGRGSFIGVSELFDDGLVEPGVIQEGSETLEYDPLGPISHSTEPEFIEEAVAKVESDGDGPDESGSSSWLQDWIDDWRADLRGRPWFRILCEAKLMIDQRRLKKTPPPAVKPPEFMPGDRRDGFVAPSMGDFGPPYGTPHDSLSMAVDNMASAVRSLEHTISMSRYMPRQDQVTVHVPQPVWLPPSAPQSPAAPLPQTPADAVTGMGGHVTITGGAGGSTSGMPGGVQLHVPARTLKDAVLDGMGDFAPLSDSGGHGEPTLSSVPADGGMADGPLVEPTESVAVGAQATSESQDSIAVGAADASTPEPVVQTPSPVNISLIREEVVSTIARLNAALEAIKKLN